MKPDTFLLALGIALGPVGCASTQFDRHFEARQFADAARTFEADTALQTRERALFRAGIMHGMPQSPVYQPVLARQLIERLLLFYPNTTHREEANRILALLTEVERLEGEAARHERERVDSATELADLRRRIEWMETRFEVQEGEAALLRQVIERLEDDLQERESAFHAIQTELARLKEIDLGPARSSAPAPTRGGASREPRDTTTSAPTPAEPPDRR